MFPRVLLLLILLSFLPGAAQADAFYVAPLPTGNDANNNCQDQSKPCATFQRAADLCPFAGFCGINAAPGIYSQKTDITWYKTVVITGPSDNHGTCIDRGAVTVDDRENGSPKAGTLFSAQDHPILTLRCMTLRAYAEQTSGLATRQFAIADAQFVDFAGFPAGVGVNAQESSKINVFSPKILGEFDTFAAASDTSQLSFGGEVYIGPRASFRSTFVTVEGFSILTWHPTEIIDNRADKPSSSSYLCIDSTIHENPTLPGGDVASPGSSNCHIR